jgi:hypothetical protein
VKTVVIEGMRLRSLNELLRLSRGERIALTKRQHDDVGWMLLGCVGINRPALPLAITIVRIGPRPMDDDNVVGSAKTVRDSIAKYLGVDDADKRIVWRYEQAKGAYAVRIQISGGETSAR